MPDAILNLTIEGSPYTVGRYDSALGFQARYDIQSLDDFGPLGNLRTLMPEDMDILAAEFEHAARVLKVAAKAVRQGLL